jgi:hypothetical protein
MQQKHRSSKQSQQELLQDDGLIVLCRRCLHLYVGQVAALSLPNAIMP